MRECCQSGSVRGGEGRPSLLPRKARSDGLPLTLFGMEATSAVNRAVALRLKWHAGRQSALSAGHLGASSRIFSSTNGPLFQPTTWAAFRLVYQCFAGIELLLSGRKNKLQAAITAREVFVQKDHWIYTRYALHSR